MCVGDARGCKIQLRGRRFLSSDEPTMCRGAKLATNNNNRRRSRTTVHTQERERRQPRDGEGERDRPCRCQTNRYRRRTRVQQCADATRPRAARTVVRSVFLFEPSMISHTHACGTRQGYGSVFPAGGSLVPLQLQPRARARPRRRRASERHSWLALPNRQPRHSISHARASVQPHQSHLDTSTSASFAACLSEKA
jgi:hypothetical protein